MKSIKNLILLLSITFCIIIMNRVFTQKPVMLDLEKIQENESACALCIGPCNLVRHIYKKHMQKNATECPICKKKPTIPLKSHIFTTHCLQESHCPIGNIDCYTCLDHAFFYDPEFAADVDTGIYNDNLFLIDIHNCLLCNGICKLAQHVFNHLKGRNVACPTCKEQLFSNQELETKEHLFTHCQIRDECLFYGEKCYKCPEHQSWLLPMSSILDKASLLLLPTKTKPAPAPPAAGTIRGIVAKNFTCSFCPERFSYAHNKEKHEKKCSRSSKKRKA